jgi:hypothetical protein
MNSIHQRAGRQLKKQRRPGTDAEGEADINLAPALPGQIDGEERSEGRLKGADKEIEAAQSTLGEPERVKAGQTRCPALILFPGCRDVSR